MAQGAARIVLFLDIATVEGRQAFSEVARYALQEGVELVVMHAPRGGCRGEALMSYSCVGARVLECASRQAPKDVLRVLGHTLDLQWEPRFGDVDALLDRLRELGLARAELAACAEDLGTIAAVVAQAGLADRLGLSVFGVEAIASPKAGGFLFVGGERGVECAPFGEGATRELLRQLHMCMVDERCEEERS